MTVIQQIKELKMKERIETIRVAITAVKTVFRILHALRNIY